MEGILKWLPDILALQSALQYVHLPFGIEEDEGAPVIYIRHHVMSCTCHLHSIKFQ